MPKSLPIKTRKKLLNRVLRQKVPVAQACREFGISRYTFYKWLKRHKAGRGLKDKSRRVKKFWRQADEKVVEQVRSIALEHPNWSKYQIQKALPKYSKGRPILGIHGVYNILRRLSLSTPEKRLLQKQLIQNKRPRVLTSEERLAMINRVLRGGANVVGVCREFGISRYTFYKWLKRYHKASPTQRLLALSDKKRQVERWWRQATPEQEEFILKVVIESPTLSKYKIAERLTKIIGRPVLGPHGVYNVLRRRNLTLPEARLAYARAQAPVITPAAGLLETVKRFFGKIPAISAIPPPAREKIVSAVYPFVASFLTSVVFSTIFIYWLRIVSQAPTLGTKLGLLSATIALGVGSLFFAYSMKYYLTLAIVLSFSRQPQEEGGGYTVSLDGRLNNNQRNNHRSNWLQRIFGLGNGNGPTSSETSRGMVQAGGLQPSLDHIKLKRYPFVSIHLPFYNEKKVAERILKACTSIDYPSTRSARSGQVPQANFEIIVCDDSTDETIDIVQGFARKHNQTHPHGPKIKVLHRKTRQGFKGGALGHALKHIDPRAEFVVVFDADFIPYPDTLELFIKYFKANNNGSEDYKKSNIACVAGYQWHVLNKSENWVTRGVRAEYAGSYVIERPGQEILGAMKLIHGSVYAIRADILKKFGWGTSITEDFELTLRLYAQGYKVVYTPYIQGPAECVSTLKRLIRQRMRWSEGHSHCVKKMFLKLLSSPKMSLTEKLEFLYLSPYYLQAFFFLIGTFSWLLAETVFRARLPFWTSLWGWSLVLTNFFSLPLVNAVGLFLEESEEKDYLGLLSFVALSYILVPFQAYASVKGFLEKQEGPWFRTPKTGLITDIFTRGRFYRWISGIIPGRVAPARISTDQLRMSTDISANQFPISANPYVALATANNQFNNFQVKPRRMKWIGKVVLVSLLVLSLTLYSLSGTMIKPVQAAISGTGDGSDGAITISASTDCQTTDISTADGDSTADCIATFVDLTSSSGQTTLNVNSTTGFYANDDIFIVTILGTNPAQGTYEFRTIQSVGASSFTLTENLTNTYTYSSNVDETMVVRVPQYTDVTINSGGILLVSAYSTTANTGGVLVFKASGTVTVNSGGSIIVDSKGFSGGSAQSGGAGGTAGGAGSGGSAGTTGSGPGSGSGGGTGGSPGGGNATKGGGGAGGTAGGGGGGAYGVTGNTGTAGTAGTGGDGGDGGANNGGAGSAGTAGTAGSSYGVANLSTIFFGSGGGSGASGAGGGAGDVSGGGGGIGRWGGGGGGMVFLWAQTITVSGSISANGSSGGAGASGGGGSSAREEALEDAAGGGGAPGGGGGGGAGGSVFIRGGSVTLGTNLVTATGATGGSGGAAGGNGGGYAAFSPIYNKSGGASSAGAGGGGATDSNNGKAATGGSAGSGGGGSVGRIHVEYETKDSFTTNPAADELVIPEKLLIFVPLAIFLPKIVEWVRKRLAYTN